MNENFLIWFIIAIVLMVAIQQQGGHSSPPLSVKALTDYYRRALRLLLEHRWLAIFPFSLYALEFLLGLPQEFMYRNRMENMSGFQPQLLAWPDSAMIQKAVQLSWHHALVQDSIYKMDRAWYGALSGKNVNIALFLVSFLLVAMPKLRSEIETQLDESARHARQFLISSWITGLVILVINFVIFLVLRQNSTILPKTLLPLVVFDSIRSIASIVALGTIVSLLEAFYITTAFAILRRETLDLRRLVNPSIKAYPGLYWFNVFLGSFFLVLNSPKYFVGRYHQQPPGLLWLLTYEFFQPFIAVALITVPFFMVVGKGAGLFDALLSQGRLLRSHLSQYAQIVFGGIALLFIPSFLRNFSEAIIPPHTFVWLDVHLVFNAMHITLASWFFVAILAWFIDVVRTPSID